MMREYDPERIRGGAGEMNEKGDVFTSYWKLIYL